MEVVVGEVSQPQQRASCVEERGRGYGSQQAECDVIKMAAAAIPASVPRDVCVD